VGTWRDLRWAVRGWQAIGWTPLHSAARDGRPEAVQALIEAGADLYAKNNGKTALDVANWSCAKGDIGASEAKALLEAAIRAGVHENEQRRGGVPVTTALAENRRLLREAFLCLRQLSSPRTSKAIVQGVMKVLKK